MALDGVKSIQDVAKQARVSTATVSRVLNNSTLVRPETAAEVQRVIKKLGYHPFTLRRRPREGSVRRGPKSRSIALLSIGQVYRDWFGIPVMAAVIGAATEAARHWGWNVALDEMPDVRRVPALLQRRRAEGAIVFVGGNIAATSELVGLMERLSAHVPIVWAMGFSPVPVPVDHVTVDNLGIGYLAQRYLLDRGCRRLAYVVTWPNLPIVRWRWKAFSDSLPTARAFAIASEATAVEAYRGAFVQCGSMTDVADRLTSMTDAPDGIFVPMGSDAPELFALLKQRGVEPGRDIEVVVSDAEQVKVSHLSPAPAVIDLQTELIGYRAIRQLHHRMQEPGDAPVAIQVMPRLIEPHRNTELHSVVSTPRLEEDSVSPVSRF